MILRGSQRKNAVQIAQHLLKTEENEHVEVHGIKGFSSTNIGDALNEAETISRGTKCSQFMFSVSLNPPQNESAPIEYFEDAIEKIEDKMNLKDQPRIIVFHEKEGRRHAHCVWSRIDAKEMKAINLPYYKQKLNDVSRQLYLKHDWELPKGYIDRQFRDPLNYTLAEYQQAKRADIDPRMLKALFKQTWDRSDNKQAFTNALRSHGFTLARGDRRSFVAIDYQGEVYSISRWSGIKTRALKVKLGGYDDLPSTQAAKTDISRSMTPVLQNFIQDVRKQRTKKYLPLKNAKLTMRDQHRHSRTKLDHAQRNKHEIEEQQRINRLPKGLKSLLSRITGRYSKILKQNTRETEHCNKRDRNEKNDLITKQLQERQRLQEKIQTVRQEHNEVMLQMREDIARYVEMKEQGKQEEHSFTLQQAPNNNMICGGERCPI